MPRKKYINTSVTLRYWDMIAKLADKQISPEFKNFVSEVTPKIDEIKKLNGMFNARQQYDIENTDSLEEQYNNYEKRSRTKDTPEKEKIIAKQKAELEKRIKAAKKNETVYYENLQKIKDLREEIDGIKDKYGNTISEYDRNLNSVVKFVSGVKKGKKVALEASQKDLLYNALNFAATSMFIDDKAIEVNGSKQTGEAARKLFANMANRDKDKFYSYGITKSDNIMEYEAVKAPDFSKKDELAESVKKLEERLLKADDNMHVNSREYRAMKAAFKNVKKSLSSATHPMDIGNALEKLQLASVNYISEKGFNGQSSDLGKERFALALDIANMSYDYGREFPSREMYERAYVSTHEYDIRQEELDKYIDKLREDNSVFKSPDVNSTEKHGSIIIGHYKTQEDLEMENEAEEVYL